MSTRAITFKFLGNPTGVQKAAKQAEQATEKSTGRIGKNVDKLKTKMVGAFAGIAVGSLVKDSIDAASDLEETGTKLGAIFGTAAVDVQAFGDKGAKALGMSKLEALDAAATFGVFGKAAGLTGKNLTGFSTELTGLAVDLASFHNASPEEAIGALGGALRGEAEPMRRFGVMLDDATMRNEALRMGLIKSTKTALNPQQKTLAAHALILKATKDAQGDFAKTSGGLANQTRIAKAQFADLKAQLGAKLLPVMTGIVSLITGKLIPGLSSVGAFLQRNKDTVLTLVTAAGALAAGFVAYTAVTKVATAVTAAHTAVTKAGSAAQWLLNAAMRANPIGLVIGAVVALGVAFVALWKKSETFRAIVTGAWNAIKGAALSVSNFFTKTLGPGVARVFTAIWQAGVSAKDWIVRAFTTLVSWVRGLPGRIAGAAGDLFGAIRARASAVKTAATILLSGIVTWVRGLPGRIGGAAGDMFRWFRDRARDVVGAVGRIWTGLITSISGLPARISRVTGGLFDGIKEAFKQAINWIIGKWNNFSIGMDPVKVAGKTVVPGMRIHTPDIPYLATGGRITQAGAAIVGERGPELVTLPAGATVHSNTASAAMLQPEIRVFIGDRELTDLVRVEIDNDKRQTRRAVLSGSRGLPR